MRGLVGKDREAQHISERTCTIHRQAGFGAGCTWVDSEFQVLLSELVAQFGETLCEFVSIDIVDLWEGGWVRQVCGFGFLFELVEEYVGLFAGEALVLEVHLRGGTFEMRDAPFGQLSLELGPLFLLEALAVTAPWHGIEDDYTHELDFCDM